MYHDNNFGTVNIINNNIIIFLLLINIYLFVQCFQFFTKDGKQWKQRSGFKREIKNVFFKLIFEFLWLHGWKNKTSKGCHGYKLYLHYFGCHGQR